MADLFDRLDDRMVEFINQQAVFFVATAAAAGRISLSPKGMDTLRVLDQSTVAYLDLTGSGNETAAHVTADGRVTIMLCSFDRRPLILRLYGRGAVVARGTPRWDELSPRFPAYAGARQIIVLHIDSVQTSCGYAVPVMEQVEPRDALLRWSRHQGEDGLRRYREQHNRSSIDGLPAPATEPAPPAGSSGAPGG